MDDIRFIADALKKYADDTNRVVEMLEQAEGRAGSAPSHGQFLLGGMYLAIRLLRQNPSLIDTVEAALEAVEDERLEPNKPLLDVRMYRDITDETARTMFERPTD